MARITAEQVREWVEDGLPDVLPLDLCNDLAILAFQLEADQQRIAELERERDEEPQPESVRVRDEDDVPLEGAVMRREYRALRDRAKRAEQQLADMERQRDGWVALGKSKAAEATAVTVRATEAEQQLRDLRERIEALPLLGHLQWTGQWISRAKVLSLLPAREGETR